MTQQQEEWDGKHDPPVIITVIENSGLDQDKRYICIENPNIIFHQKVEGLVDSKIQQHIYNWRSYQENSKEMQNFYKDLENDRQYFQWLFPNFFRSHSNPDCRRLTLKERNEIIANQDLTAFYLENFQMFMLFLGIDAFIAEKPHYLFKIINKQQFIRCLHGSMAVFRRRLQRVFASLSVLGQRELALSLLNFLKKTLNSYHEDRLYDLHFRQYEMIEEDETSDISFKKRKHYYVQERLKTTWLVDYTLLTRNLIQHDSNSRLNKYGRDIAIFCLIASSIVIVILITYFY